MQASKRPLSDVLCNAVGWLALTASLTGLACSGGSASSPGSKTPRLTVASSTPLAAALLTTDDLKGVPGLPSDVHAADLNSLSVFEDPDPRGPCGAKLTPVDLSSGAGVGIQSTAVQGVEVVVPLGAAVATSYLDGLEADSHEGCPAYQSLTNTGAQQTVQLERLIALPELADQRHAAVLTITNNGHTATVEQILLRASGTIAMVLLFTAAPLGDGVVAALAARVADHLTKLA